MRDGIQWLVDLDDWNYSITFARGIAPEELAVRMGGDLGSAPAPITDADAWDAVFEGMYRPGEDGDGMVRVGKCEGWSFALEYGDSTGRERLAEVSRDGVEAVHLDPQPEHPPMQFAYASPNWWRRECSTRMASTHGPKMSPTRTATVTRWR